MEKLKILLKSFKDGLLIIGVTPIDTEILYHTYGARLFICEMYDFCNINNQYNIIMAIDNVLRSIIHNYKVVELNENWFFVGPKGSYNFLTGEITKFW